MSTPYEIPLTPQPQQFFIALGGVQYSLTVRWCPPSSCWILDIDSVVGDSILRAIPLVPGVDLLAQYAHLKIGGSLYVQSDSDQYAIPSYTSLGVSGHLYFVVP